MKNLVFVAAVVAVVCVAGCASENNQAQGGYWAENFYSSGESESGVQPPPTVGRPAAWQFNAARDYPPRGY